MAAPAAITPTIVPDRWRSDAAGADDFELSRVYQCPEASLSLWCGSFAALADPSRAASASGTNTPIAVSQLELAAVLALAAVGPTIPRALLTLPLAEPILGPTDAPTPPAACTAACRNRSRL